MPAGAGHGAGAGKQGKKKSLRSTGRAGQKGGARGTQGKTDLDGAVTAALSLGSAGDSRELFRRSIDEQLQTLTGAGTAAGVMAPPVPKQRGILTLSEVDASGSDGDAGALDGMSSYYSGDADTDLQSPSMQRYMNMNMNMSIRMPSTEDASHLQADGELGLDSAR